MKRHCFGPCLDYAGVLINRFHNIVRDHLFMATAVEY